MSAPDDHEVRLLLASRFASIAIAERALADLCVEAGCDTDDEFWVMTALREALANAIRHGNHENPARKVAAALRLSGDRVEVRVDDEGEGFDPAAVPDPTGPEQLLEPRGRGIFYMRQFMNRVEYGRTAAGGTSVLMVREVKTGARSSHDEE